MQPPLVERQQSTESLCKRVSGLRGGVRSILLDLTDWQEGWKPQECADKSIYRGQTKRHSASFVLCTQKRTSSEKLLYALTSFLLVLVLRAGWNGFETRCWRFLSLTDLRDERVQPALSSVSVNVQPALSRLLLPPRERQPAGVFHPIPLISPAKIPCLQKAI